MAGFDIGEVFMISEGLKFIPLVVGQCRYRAFITDNLQAFWLIRQAQGRAVADRLILLYSHLLGILFS